MMRRSQCLNRGWAAFVAGSLACLGIVEAVASPVRVNLGTLAPRGSVYYRSLKEMGEKWRDAPGDGARLVVYADGTQGGEADMVRLMRVGTLHAGLLTAVGLADIEPSVAGLQAAPMLFRSLEEFEFVSQRLRPKLEARLLEKGFIVLFWADAGWIHYFSKAPLFTPADLKQRKLFVWAGHPEQTQLLRSFGYTPVALETEQIIPGLTTGLIDVVAVPPIFALAGQLDTRAPHMLELNWAPLVGAAVVSRKTWDRIPDGTKKAMLAAATAAGREVQASGRKESKEAVAAMVKRGLQVHPVTSELEKQWRAAAEEIFPHFRDKIVPADIHDEILRLLREYRAQASGRSE